MTGNKKAGSGGGQGEQKGLAGEGHVGEGTQNAFYVTYMYQFPQMNITILCYKHAII